VDINQRSEVGSRESGVRSQESAVRSQESGVRSQKSEVGSRQSEVRREQSGVGRERAKHISCSAFSAQHSAFCPTSGQAMIEVMVGMIALLVLVAGTLQLASLTKAQTDTMAEAREEAGRRSLSDLPLSETPQYIRDIDAGPDGRTYSYDDTTTRAGGGLFHDTITARAVSNPGEWSILDEAENKSFSALNNAGSPIANFGLLKGSATRTITLRPAVRSLIYRAEEIDMESEVWSTWTKGVY